MLKLKLQYFGHLMRTDNSLEKSLMLGKIEDRRRRGHQRMRWLDGITDAMNMNLGKNLGDGERQGSPACCSPWGHKESDMTGQLNSNNKKTLDPVLDMKVKIDRNFLMVQWLRLQAPNVGGLDSIPSQGTRSHMLQPRVHMPQLKIPHATNKTWCIQINYFF